MLDRKLPLVAGDEQRAGFEPSHCALAQGLQRRVVDRFPRVAVDDAENLPDRPAAGFGDRPSGHLLGDFVQQQHAAVGIGGDHSVADAAERGAQPFALAAQFHERRVAIAVGAPHRADRGPREHGEHENAQHGEDGERR